MLVMPRLAHAYLASLTAFSTADKDRAASRVEIALLKCERFADPQPCAPQQDDQRAQPSTLSAISDPAHHFDDLLDGWRVGWVALALVPRWAAAVVARHRCRRASMAGNIEQNGLHESSLVGMT
jgi:hypothetical protein